MMIYKRLCAGLLVLFVALGTLLPRPIQAQGSKLEKITGESAGKLKLLATLKGHTDNVLTTAFSPDGTLLASGGVDTTVRLWNIKDVNAVQPGAVLKGHTKQVALIGFSLDSKTLISTGYDHSVRLWDVQSGKQTSAQENPNLLVDNMLNAFSPDMSLLAYNSGFTFGTLWDLKNGKLLNAKLNSDGVITSGSFAFALDGHSVYMADPNGNTIHQFPVSEGEQKVVLTGPDGAKYYGPLAINSDGSLLAVEYSMDDFAHVGLHLFDIKTGKLQSTLPTDDQEVFVLTFTPDGSLLVSAGYGGTQFWDAKTGKLVATLPKEGIPTDAQYANLLAVSFNADGTLMAVGVPKFKGDEFSVVQVWGIPAA